MKKLFMIITSFLLMLIIVSCGAKDISYRSIKVYEHEGSVEVTRKNKQIDVYNDLRLKSDDTITTNDESHAILKLDEDKFIYVFPNTKLNLISSKSDSSKTRLNILEGKIISEVKDKLSSDESYEAAGSNSCMSIRGTYFAVSVTNDLESNTSITEYDLVTGKTVIDLIANNDNKYEAITINQATSTKVIVKVALDDVIKADEDIEYTIVSEISSDKLVYDSTGLTTEEINDLLSYGISFNRDNIYRLTTINSNFYVDREMYRLYESNKKFEVLLSANNLPYKVFSHFAIIDLSKYNLSSFSYDDLSKIEYEEYYTGNEPLEIDGNYLIVAVYEDGLYLENDFDSINISTPTYAYSGQKVLDYINDLKVYSSLTDGQIKTNVDLIDNKFVNFSVRTSEGNYVAIYDDAVFDENEQYVVHAYINYDYEEYEIEQSITIIPNYLGQMPYMDYDYDIYYDYNEGLISLYLYDEKVEDIIVNNEFNDSYFLLN